MLFFVNNFWKSQIGIPSFALRILKTIHDIELVFLIHINEK